jgi:hypothetical protein
LRFAHKRRTADGPIFGKLPEELQSTAGSGYDPQFEQVI